MTATIHTIYRDAQFLDFCSKMSEAMTSPSYRKDIKRLTKCDLRYIDGSRWITTWFEDTIYRWEWIVEKTCEEFNCSPAQVSCIDGMQDPDDYEGPDARKDKVAVDGKAVGYIV